MNNLRSTVNVSQVDFLDGKKFIYSSAQRHCCHCNSLPAGGVGGGDSNNGDNGHALVGLMMMAKAPALMPDIWHGNLYLCPCSIEPIARHGKHEYSLNVCQSADVSLLVSPRNNACQVPGYKFYPSICRRSDSQLTCEFARDSLNVTDVGHCTERVPVVLQEKEKKNSQNNFVICMEADSSETRHNSVSSLQPLLLESHDHL